jgi:hypothetical protein
MTPMRANPINSIAQVEGSGTVVAIGGNDGEIAIGHA